MRRTFQRFFVSGGTVGWPSGADIAADCTMSAQQYSTSSIVIGTAPANSMAQAFTHAPSQLKEFAQVTREQQEPKPPKGQVDGL
jgi:hypothetical protein